MDDMELNNRKCVVENNGQWYVGLLHGERALIDARDVERVKKHSWYGRYSKFSNRVYASRCYRKKGGDIVTMALGRFILETDKKVKYLNGNTLDCRRSNLEIMGPKKPFERDGLWILPLSNSLEAIIDKDDVKKVIGFSWYSTGLKYKRIERTARKDGGTKYLTHLILGLNGSVRKTNPSLSVYHINGNKLDCRKSNLLY